MLTVASFAFAIVACKELGPAAPREDELLDGPVAGLTSAQSARHLAGDIAFNDDIFTPETGLGPVFVANSCGSCHLGDGKGHPFTTLIRFGHTDSLGQNEFDHGFQIQNRAIPGYEPEELPKGAPFAKFIPPINTGLGYLELVSDEDILAMAAANATNPDGVRGRPNWNLLPSYVTPRPNSRRQGNRYITRFGKKGSVYNLFHQTVVAYNQDMGITSTFDPSDVYTLKSIDPEVSDREVRDVVFYLQTLKAPIQRNADDPAVLRGQQLFVQTGCESCHKQTLKTGYSPVTALSTTEFHPYTDLLLHNMGPGLDDGYTEGSAGGAEWRTPPLWGLGLAQNSQGGQVYLMHDGRARSIKEAIKMHGGEAASVQKRFEEMPAANQADVIAFLKSL